MSSDARHPSEKIFDLAKDLPPPINEEQVCKLRQVDELARKISILLKNGWTLPEKELPHILNLIPDVLDCPQAASSLGFVFLMLGEFCAMRDLYRELSRIHGELPPFLYFQALAEEKLGNDEEALGLLQKLIASGVRNYWVFYRAALIQHGLGLYRESAAMANLAVYENIGQDISAFALLARNFHALGELNRMLECFRRIEKLRGGEGLAELGDLYHRYRDMYENLKSFVMDGCEPERGQL